MKITLTVFFFLVSFFVSAQRTYLKEWKRIDSLIGKVGLLKTALKEVNAIYVSAKKESNDVQIIKALLYKLQLNDQLSDQGRYENIALLEKEINTAKEPARSILHSITGSSYLTYLQMNRWQFYNRTNTKGYDNNDIATWTLEQLYQRIANHFDKSLASKKLLQQTSLTKFDPIIIKGNARNLRPTLYDLLAFRALYFFRNDERYLTQPSFIFKINEDEAFADAKEFARYLFKNSDSLSLHYRAIQLYQELLSFHEKDQNPAALIDADLDRLQFVKNFSTLTNKEALYRTALERLSNKYANETAAAEVHLKLADWHMEKAGNYDPLSDTSTRFEYVKANDIIEKGLALKPANSTMVALRNMKKTIGHESLTMQAEQVNTVGDPFRLLVNYKNVDKAYIRVIQLNRKVWDKVRGDEWSDNFWNKLSAVSPLKEYNEVLPATNDYQQHRVELKIDGLPTGEYGILMSSTPDFKPGKYALALQRVYVSDISFINNGGMYYVLNRKSGAPVWKASIQVWQEYYNSATKRSEFKQLDKLTTDKNGAFVIKSYSNNNIQLEIASSNDHLFLDNNVYSYAYDGEKPSKDTTRDETFLFTDRPLYRPGQTVFFKGIVVKKNVKARTSSIISSRHVTIQLVDANSQPIDSIHLTTNEFGSVSGRFTIPTGVLNGSFGIRDSKNENQYPFLVEDYKRPRFFVAVSPPAGTYRLNDTITVKGVATSYAGNGLTDAKVNYRVVRRANFPMWIRSDVRIWPPYPREEMEISNGSSVTGADGEFIVNFKAIADDNVPKSLQPIFNYDIIAEVTDMNGETRSATTSVSVGYQAIKLNVDVPGEMHVDSVKKIQVYTTNMNDSFERSKVHVEMYELAAPQRLFRNRYWEQPDQFVMNQTDYHRYFPYDVYAGEDAKERWPKGSRVYEVSGLASPDSAFTIVKKALQAGWYVIETSAIDRFGDTVKDRRYMQLYKDKPASPQLSARLVADKKELQAGETVYYEMRTNVDSAHVINEIVRTGKEKNITIISSPNKLVKGEIATEPSDKSGLLVQISFVKFNRFFADVLHIPIVNKTKELNIEYATFRDKAVPGGKEKWKVKISGGKGEKVAAELLTSMYDASLDQYYTNTWAFNPFFIEYPNAQPWTANGNFEQRSSVNKYFNDYENNPEPKTYDQIMQLDGQAAAMIRRETNVKFKSAGQPAVLQDAAVTEGADVKEESQSVADSSVTKKETPPLLARKNLNETAFFFPDLRTDSAGNIEFTFTTPEALTTWKWRLLAHTRDLANAYGEKSFITQKQLMVQPNAPRFLRAGDSIRFVVKVANMTNKEIRGNATLQLFDAVTGKETGELMATSHQSVSFNAPAHLSVPVAFTLVVPKSFTSPITWRVIAASTSNDVSLSDGEENILPVVSNRALVTETLPLHLRGEEKKTFRFDKLLNSGDRPSITNHLLTVEFTSNPAWYAVQSLPWLNEQKDENAEQAFNRLYANALAEKIANSTPKLKAVIEKWKLTDTAAFLSALQKNEQLKSALLEETPWVLDAKTESQQKKNIALLFDVTSIASGISASLTKLQLMQAPSGAFAWLPGGGDDRYITQYVVTGFGRLKQLGALSPAFGEKTGNMIKRAIAYLDQQIKSDHDKITKNTKKIAGTYIAYEPIQYLYMRGFFKDVPLPASVKPAFTYFNNQVKKNWVKQNTYMRAMIALSAQRNGDATTARNIIAALTESAIIHEETGMYWKDMNGGYYWYQAPVETQALLIEAFSEITHDENIIANLKTWLLKNKQTNSWRTSRATADACYALLLQGGDWLGNDQPVSITAGEKTFSSSNAEAGTGYFKSSVPGKELTPSMGAITINMPRTSSTRPTWGAVYWQYFEDLDNVTGSTTSLQVSKKLFTQTNTDRGPVIEPLNKNNTLHVGDHVRVRMEIRTDRPMEYVHLKDMRSSAMEPVNVISEYKSQNGLGYYESTKDASTNFYFSYLPKGVHVFEYDLFVTHEGRFSNGIATIQCMYAPEFSSNSEGIIVNVK